MTAPPTLTIFAPPDLLAALRDEDSIVLLSIMARAADDQERADAAWKVFYLRHGGWLWGKCREAARELGGDTWVDDIFLDTMEAVYLHAAKFRVPEHGTPEETEALLKGWLGKITNNNLRRRLEGRRNEVTVSEEQWTMLSPKRESPTDSDAKGGTPSWNQQAFAEAFASLSEREQTVLRVTFQYHRFGSEFQRLSNEVTKDLAAQLGTTPENLRAIRKRALDKLRARFPQPAPPTP